MCGHDLDLLEFDGQVQQVALGIGMVPQPMGLPLALDLLG
jgi:hypothetical protein